MVRKILQYGVIVGLVAVLVGGMVYILARPAAAQAERGWERATVAPAGQTTDGIGGGPGNSGGRGNAYRVAEGGALLDREYSRQSAANVNGGGQGVGNGAGGPGTGSGPNATEPEIHDWLTVQGTVLVADNELTIQTSTGELIIGMGQAWYREQAGFTVAVGDEVVVYGFDEDEEFKAGTVENRTTGDTIMLRDATGRPMWAGNGNNRNRP